jgi:3-hydroxymyristoyl/3-hydroxydecanoyl-(acyl carrier protein) dehydratase
MVRWKNGPRIQSDGSITAETVIDADDPWFDGHFPGAPVLPAVAQLAMVRELIRSAVDPDAEVAGIRRVKFKEMIQPGQELSLSAARKKGSDSVFAFKLICAGRLACSGTVMLRRGDSDTKEGLRRKPKPADPDRTGGL